MIVHYHGKLIEIQVRTELQHLWAELSEKLSDVIEPAIKYGGGDEIVQEILADTSRIVVSEELLEAQFMNRQTQQDNFPNDDERVTGIQESLAAIRKRIFKNLRETIAFVEGLKGENDALSD